MASIESLTAFQLDVMKEIGNIGSGNAATALSKMLNKKIDMHVPSVRVVDFDEMMNLVGGPEEIITAVFLRIEGEAPGQMFFILSPEEAESFVKQLTGIDDFSVIDHPDNPMALSALQEIGNILAGSYLSALSDFIGGSLQPSIPLLTIDMAGAILSVPAIEFGKIDDRVLLIKTEFLEGGESVLGNYILLPDPPSFNKILTSLGATL